MCSDRVTERQANEITMRQTFTCGWRARAHMYDTPNVSVFMMMLSLAGWQHTFFHINYNV